MNQGAQQGPRVGTRVTLLPKDDDTRKLGFLLAEAHHRWRSAVDERLARLDLSLTHVSAAKICLVSSVLLLPSRAVESIPVAQLGIVGHSYTLHSTSH